MQCPHWYLLNILHRHLLQLGLAFLSLWSLQARAVDDCSTVGFNGVTPCNTQPATGVRKEETHFSLRDGSRFEVITPQIVADDLGVQAPGFAPLSAYYQIFVNKLAPNRRLLVLIPGGDGLPQNLKRFAEHAAEKGYHVVTLHYWNNDSDATACKFYEGKRSTGDGTQPPYTYDGCITDLYEGLFWNPDALTPVIKADKANGKTPPPLNDSDPLQSRLVRVLQFLSKNFPDDGWEQFAPGGLVSNYGQPPYIDWELVTLAGHSNGSKLMAHVATQVRVYRLILLSGPNVEYIDPRGESHCPTSVGRIGATPVQRYYAYYNTNDPNNDKAQKCFQRMKFPARGGRKSIHEDYAKAGAHEIYNDQPARNACDADHIDHNSTAADCGLEPVMPGVPILPTPRLTYDVWDYLLGSGYVGVDSPVDQTDQSD